MRECHGRSSADHGRHHPVRTSSDRNWRGSFEGALQRQRQTGPRGRFNRQRSCRRSMRQGPTGGRQPYENHRNLTIDKCRSYALATAVGWGADVGSLRPLRSGQRQPGAESGEHPGTAADQGMWPSTLRMGVDESQRGDQDRQIRNVRADCTWGSITEIDMSRGVNECLRRRDTTQPIGRE